MADLWESRDKRGKLFLCAFARLFSVTSHIEDSPAPLLPLRLGDDGVFVIDLSPRTPSLSRGQFPVSSHAFVGDGWPLTFGWGYPVQTGDDSWQREADTIWSCQALKCITLKARPKKLSWVESDVSDCFRSYMSEFWLGLFGKSSCVNSSLFVTR